MPPRLQALRLATSLLAPHVPRPAQSLTPFLACTQQHRSASILSSLSDTPGAYNKRIRRGRGPASGKGKTSGRGQKGQHAHGKVPAGFEGGQTPLSITKPERGRNKFNPFKVEMSPVNLDRIQSWIDQGRIDAKRLITMKELSKSRCIHGVRRHGVKLLARNADKLTSEIHIVVSRASSEAIARVEALGGSVTTRYYSPTSIKRVLSQESHPVISLQTGPELLNRAIGTERKPNSPFRQLSDALSAPETPAEAKHKALSAVMETLRQRYKYRLPDPAGRKDIEYYRDPAHRGYLSYTVKQGESPSLFFKPPREGKDKRKVNAKKAAAKVSAENRLF